MNRRNKVWRKREDDDESGESERKRPRKRRKRFQPVRKTGKGGMAAVLSAVVPGLGLVYVGQIAAGLMVMVGFPVFVAIANVVLGFGALALSGKSGGMSFLLMILVGVLAPWAGQVYWSYSAGERGTR